MRLSWKVTGVSLYIFQQEVIWHRFVKCHKKHKSTKNSFNSIFKKCQSSGQYGGDFWMTSQPCHGSLASQMTLWKKCTFEKAKETFLQINQNYNFIVNASNLATFIWSNTDLESESYHIGLVSVQLFVAVWTGNGYSNRGENKRVGGRTGTQKDGSKYKRKWGLGFSRQTLSANCSWLVPSRYLFIPARLNLLPNLQSSLTPKTHK